MFPAGQVELEAVGKHGHQHLRQFLGTCDSLNTNGVEDGKNETSTASL
jgi:hypothetical protein